MKLMEVADKINAHLRRIFEDPALNPMPPGGRRRFYHPGARAAGAYITVWSVSYMGKDSLRKAEAETYLAWLEAGNVGEPYEMRRQAAALKGSAAT